MAIAGDSVGGNMTAAIALLAKERGDVHFVQQSLYYPVTDAAMDSDSYEEIAEGYFLTAKAMAWFWDAYLPDIDRRSEPFASLRCRSLALGEVEALLATGWGAFGPPAPPGRDDAAGDPPKQRT